MFDIGLVFIFQNIIILMLIFWLLSWLGDRFYKQRGHKSSDCVYECGFTSTHALRVTVNFGFFVTALLLILYDIEFFFLVPALFGASVSAATEVVVVWSFFVFVVLSFALDWASVSLKWL